MKKVCALFTLYGINCREKFKDMVENSINSFKKWHPDIELIFDVDDTKPHNPHCHRRVYKTKELLENGYTKVISMDIDTITCARFTEFLEDDTSPFIGSQGFMCHNPKYINQELFFAVPHREIIEYPYVNTGVCCVQSLQFVNDLIKLIELKNKETQEGKIDPYYTGEEIIMNYDIINNEGLQRVRIVDYPYKLSSFCYNVRLFDIVGSECIRDDGIYFGMDGPKVGYGNPITRIKPLDDKLLNKDGKWIKCIHYCFSKTPKHTKIDNLDDFIPETVEWLKKYSDYVPRSLPQSNDVN